MWLPPSFGFPVVDWRTRRGARPCCSWCPDTREAQGISSCLLRLSCFLHLSLEVKEGSERSRSSHHAAPMPSKPRSWIYRWGQWPRSCHFRNCSINACKSQCGFVRLGTVCAIAHLDYTEFWDSTVSRPSRGWPLKVSSVFLQMNDSSRDPFSLINY